MSKNTYTSVRIYDNGENPKQKACIKKATNSELVAKYDIGDFIYYEHAITKKRKHGLIVYRYRDEGARYIYKVKGSHMGETVVNDVKEADILGTLTAHDEEQLCRRLGIPYNLRRHEVPTNCAKTPSRSRTTGMRGPTAKYVKETTTGACFASVQEAAQNFGLSCSTVGKWLGYDHLIKDSYQFEEITEREYLEYIARKGGKA